MQDDSRFCARIHCAVKPRQRIYPTQAKDRLEWATRPNPFYRPVKKQITLRIDADILAWLRQQGPEGYQSRLNALLRSLMLRDLEAKRKRA